jgi:predicted aspartyl protease
LSLDFHFRYLHEPFIPVVLINPASGTSFASRALIDTGAQASLFDELVAQRLGLNLRTATGRTISGIGGSTGLAGTALVEIKLLGLDALSSVLELRFVPGIEEQLGNLLGLDVLSFFDFGLSHANRVGYLGRA